MTRWDNGEPPKILTWYVKETLLKVKSGEYLQFEVGCLITEGLRKIIDGCFQTSPEKRPLIADLIADCNNTNNNTVQNISTKRNHSESTNLLDHVRTSSVQSGLEIPGRLRNNFWMRQRIKYFFMRQKYQEKIIDSRAQNEPRKIFDIVNSVGGNSINSTTRTSISVLSDTSGTLKNINLCVLCNLQFVVWECALDLVRDGSGDSVDG